MQTTAAANRITAAAHTGHVRLNLAAAQLVVDDWRLRGWTLAVGGPTWAAPTTGYSLNGTAAGDYIKKGSVAWDLGYQDLGVHTPVTLPDSTTDTPYISSIAIDANHDLICWYANRPLNGFDAGIYVQKVTDDGAGHLYWSEPIQVFGNTAIDDPNGQSQMFVTFPRLQTFNGEYWIVALECSLQGTVITYHLCYFRSLDGVHWSDRQYLAGVSNDLDEAAAGINAYDVSGTPTAFVLADLKHAYLSVSSTTCYIVGKNGNNFSCGATSLLGVTNPAKQLDITLDTTQWSLKLPTAPTIAGGSYTVKNPAQKYNASTVLVSGARLIHKAGLITDYPAAGNGELITLATELIDEKRQTTQLGENNLQLTTTDYGGWLRDWESDLFWEWFSPRQAVYDLFCDGTGFSPMNGAFVIGSDALLVAYPVDANAPYYDDLAYIHDRRVKDGSLAVQWKITTGWADHYAGIAFQGSGPNENANYWSVYLDGNDKKYKLRQATPSTTAYKYVQYSAPVQQSSAQTLSLDTFYWLKVTQWHNHVIAWHSADRKTWTKVIDYQVGVPTADALPTNLQYWGLVGRSTGYLSSAIGNTDGSGGAVAMDDGSGNPKYWALKVTTGAQKATLRALVILAGQKGLPDQLNLGLAIDNGSGTAPADLTVPANVVWASSIPSSMIGDPSAPNWAQISPDVLIDLLPSTNYWIFFYFNTALAGGQEWDWFTGGSGTFLSSTNQGATWSSASGSAAVALFVNYELGAAKFGAMDWSSGETLHTLEDLSADIAAKAGVIHSKPYAFCAQADLVLGGDGIYWPPTAFGMIGDLVLDVDVAIASSHVAEIVLHSPTVNAGSSSAYVVQLDPATQLITFTNPSFSRVIDSLQVIPAATTFHLRVGQWANFYYISINDALACILYEDHAPSLTPGYVGLVSANVTWTNFRIPDLTTIKDYYVLDAEKTALQALQDLASRVQRKKRFNFFVDYEGALVFSAFPRRSAVDAYSETIAQADDVDTQRFSISQLLPQGNYYAMRFSARELDRTGRRRFQKVDYTDAVTNEEAYAAGQLVLTRARELAEQYSMKVHVAVFPIEREDRITNTNPLDGVSDDFIVNAVNFEYQLEPEPNVSMAVDLRKFIE